MKKNKIILIVCLLANLSTFASSEIQTNSTSTVKKIINALEPLCVTITAQVHGTSSNESVSCKKCMAYTTDYIAIGGLIASANVCATNAAAYLADPEN